MEKEKPKILMIGWEFPPLINGGLGIACHDLSVAMTEFAHITMIIPKSQSGFKINNMELVGMNNVDPETLEEFNNPGYDTVEEVHGIEANLSPYYSSSEMHGEFKNLTGEGFTQMINTAGNTGKRFSVGSLYGNDVIDKVIQFGEMAAKYAEKKDFDVIHVHDWMTMIAGIKIKNRTGKPLVMHIHSLEIDRGGTDSRGWVFDIEKFGMEQADLLIPVSKFTGNNIKKYYGINANKISPVHNGIRPVNPYRKKSALREKTVLFIGRLTRQKGPEFFLDIASKVLEKDKNVRFVMAGTGDNFNKMLEDSSYRHLGNRFHLTGFLTPDNVRNLLSIADVYCMPSVSEPFGLSAVEAAQFGVPAVISKQSGVAEVMKGALKFDFWDVHKAADNILNLLYDPVLREKVINDAYEDLENISWVKSVKKVLHAYRKHKIFLN